MIVLGTWILDAVWSKLGYVGGVGRRAGERGDGPEERCTVGWRGFHGSRAWRIALLGLEILYLAIHIWLFTFGFGFGFGF